MRSSHRSHALEFFYGGLVAVFIFEIENLPAELHSRIQECVPVIRSSGEILAERLHLAARRDLGCFESSADVLRRRRRRSVQILHSDEAFFAVILASDDSDLDSRVENPRPRHALAF